MSAQQESKANIVVRKEKRISVPITIKPNSVPNLEFDTSVEGLKSFLSVIVCGPGITPEMYTIHRPIGLSRLGKETFVATRTTDVHYLLSHAVDPNESVIERKREIAFFKFAISKSLLFGTIEDPHYPAEVQGGGSRQGLLAQCQKLLKEDRTEKQKLHEADQQGKPKAAVFRYGQTIHNFMPEDMKKQEKILSELKATKEFKEIVKEFQSPYETRGGPRNTEPQESIPILAGVKTWDNASGVVFSTIREALYLESPPPGGDNMQLSRTANVPGDEEDILPRENIAKRAVEPVPAGYVYGSDDRIDAHINEAKIKALETDLRCFEAFAANIKKVATKTDVDAMASKDVNGKVNKLLSKVDAINNEFKTLKSLVSKPDPAW